MRLRSRLQLAALALLASGAAACTDESPLLTGDPYFPDGRPVTLETIIPAEGFLTLRGAYTGYSSAQQVLYTVVANEFDGGVTARTLVRFPAPFAREIEYIQDNTTKRDSLYTILSMELVLSVDSSASVGFNVPLSASRLTEPWQDGSVSWTVRSVDSTGAVFNWSQPGGAIGPVLGNGNYIVADSANRAIIPIDSDEIEAMRDSSYPGFIIQSTLPNSRIEIGQAQLRILVDPSNSVRDTSFYVTRTATDEDFAFIYTPEPPEPAGLIRAGTVLSARTLLSMAIPDSLEVCTPTCRRIATADVALNQVSLLLRPVTAGGGYRQIDSASVALRTIAEPGLGALAPLGEAVVNNFNARGAALPAIVTYAPADTVVELPFTIHAARLVRGDTVSSDFAILGATPGGIAQPPFSLLLFEPTPRLRIVYTVPERPRLP